jgi:hypothetical protein
MKENRKKEIRGGHRSRLRARSMLIFVKKY